MEEDTSDTSSMGSADPGSVAAGSDLSPEPSPAAAESDVEAVEAPTRAQLEKRLKLTQRDAKHARLKNELRKSKPQGATAHHWAYFNMYVQVSLQIYSICKLDRAEVEYNQSPTKLLRHLNTGYSGHQEAYEACKDHKAGKKSGSVSGSSSTGQREIESFFGPDTSGWHKESSSSQPCGPCTPRTPPGGQSSRCSDP